MRAFCASSIEEKERIVEEIVSDYSYEKRPMNLQSGINIFNIPAGGDVVGVELSSENPRVFIAYEQAAAMSPFPWWLASDLRELACWSWEKGVSAGSVLNAFSFPTNVPTTYTSMTYEKLLTECKNLKSENDYFRSQLLAMYAPERLQRNSILFGFLSLGSLVLSSFFGINILHPVAGYLIFGISFVFYLMSLIMKKEEKK